MSRMIVLYHLKNTDRVNTVLISGGKKNQSLKNTIAGVSIRNVYIRIQRIWGTLGNMPAKQQNKFIYISVA